MQVLCLSCQMDLHESTVKYTSGTCLCIRTHGWAKPARPKKQPAMPQAHLKRATGHPKPKNEQKQKEKQQELALFLSGCGFEAFGFDALPLPASFVCSLPLFFRPRVCQPLASSCPTLGRDVENAKTRIKMLQTDTHFSRKCCACRAKWTCMNPS